MGFDGDRLISQVGSHPFNADGAAACTDIPEKLAGKRGKGGESEGADFLFGELAVVLILGVGN